MIALEACIRVLMTFGLVWLLRDNIRNHNTEDGITRGELIFCNTAVVISIAMNLDWLADSFW